MFNIKKFLGLVNKKLVWKMKLVFKNVDKDGEGWVLMFLMNHNISEQ